MSTSKYWVLNRTSKNPKDAKKITKILNKEAKKSNFPFGKVKYFYGYKAVGKNVYQSTKSKRLY